MHQNATVSNGEWIIMELLWVKPHTLMELVTQLHASVGWSKSTVATMIRRMSQKGIVNYTEQGRAKIFTPALTREEVSVQETQSLLQRAYHGSIGLLVSTMAQKNSLTAADIEELSRILEAAKEERK
jgi:BlaI family penicillinase repressor